MAMCYLIKNKESRDKILEEVAAHMKSKNLEKGAQLNPSNDELINNFKFLNRVTNESLRFNPPAAITDQYIIENDVEFDGIKWKKGSLVYFWLWGLHHDPNVWPQHDKYLPERFDPEHKLFKTPSGEDRPAASFSPFSNGSRKCLGYKFAQLVIPIMIINLINKFEIEHVDKSLNEEDNWPIASTFQSVNPPIKIKMTKK